MTASPPPGRRSASAARRVTVGDRVTSAGRASGRAGGRSARPTIRAWGSPSASTSGAMSSGRSIRRPAMRPAITRLRWCARRSRPAACATRAAARSRRTGSGRPLSGTHVVSPLARGLYHADGQMLDEVYNYGSFKQSKMFAAGVTCGDCHDPHGAKPRAAGDGVCLQCHSSDKYAAAAHHRHEAANPSLSCASCHMPVRTYMVVDRRHDHSFRVPRPDVSRAARHAQRLQRLPHRQDRGMGSDGGRALARAEPKRLAELRGGFPRGLERQRDAAALLGVIAAIAACRPSHARAR